MKSHRKLAPSLKHAGYSTTTILPGEDPAAFEELRQSVVDELVPVGPLEEDRVETIARLLWRKKNLMTLQIAEDARETQTAIENAPQDMYAVTKDGLVPVSAAEIEKSRQDLEQQARDKLGWKYEFVELGDKVSVEGLKQNLDVEERLDARIGQCLKQLLFLRGLKSVIASSISPSHPERR